MILEKIFLTLIIILQSLSLPFLNNLSLCLIFAYLYLLFNFRKLSIDKSRFLIYGVLVFFLYTSLFANILQNKSYISIPSFLLFMVLYFPFLFKKETDLTSFLSLIKYYNSIILFVVIIEVLQFFFYILTLRFITIQDVLPTYFHLYGYNIRYYLFSLNLFKPNGFFFLEPSFLSQYIALALIVEILFFKRYIYIFSFIFGLFLTMSGTGIILFIFSSVLYFNFKLIIFFFKKKNIYILNLKTLTFIFIFVILLILFVKNFSIFFEYLLNRSKEFFTPNTSGHMRFIAPYISIGYISLDISEFLFGFGAGTAKILANLLPFQVSFTALPKLFLEYGFFGFIIYLFFLLFVTVFNFKQLQFKLLAFSLLFMNLFLSGALLQPHTIYLMYFLVSLYSFKERG